MKVQCPCCSARIEAVNINLESGWGKCAACDELFPLGEVVPSFTPLGAESGGPIERPFDARALVERSEQLLLVQIPREGMRAGNYALLGFATFWLAFVAFWTAGALGVIFGQGKGGGDLGFAAFSIPFWLVGFGMLGAVAWKAWGTRSVQIDRDGLTTHLRGPLWSRTRWVEIEHVQHARHYSPTVQSEGQRYHGVEIVYRAGSFVLPADSEEEEKWLIAEINEFLKSSDR